MAKRLIKARRSIRAPKKKNKKSNVARPFTPEAKLKRSIRAHFKALGFTKAQDGTLVLPGSGKEIVRKLHGSQRAERLDQSAAFLKRTSAKAILHFANGAEIDPTKIQLKLIRVESDTKNADLFRFATLTWSVPVSAGFGRRLRYLVWDEGHQRLVGVIALGDPVFNLSVRDNLIKWTAADRAKRLVGVLDAYVLGAVPPYNMLLCGKAVACLLRSREVFNDFKRFYGNTVGIISGKNKRTQLLAVTTTSSMGRSSVYNRLRLAEQLYMDPIGYTVGWGHFHITDRLFEEIRKYLRARRDRYASNHQFGDGPNWRLRAIRQALRLLEINESVLKHGIQREVFLCPFGPNALEILATGKGKLDISTLKTVHEISDLARDRWIVPRALRMPEFRAWKREAILELIEGVVPTLERPMSKAS
ncbi:MAG TPA: Druantia anti-phage system protein DruA [Pseudolabrys sp.]|nr:Druantia anti-phage system protein DruA [Pseudolabrys sp.]